MKRTMESLCDGLLKRTEWITHLMGLKRLNLKTNTPGVQACIFKELNMRRTLLLLTILILCTRSYGQNQNIDLNRYGIHANWEHQNLAYYPIGTQKDTLKAGWTITENKGAIQVQRTLLKDTIVSTKVDSAILIKSNWKAGEIRHTADAPDKLFVNPYEFTSPEDAYLNEKFYLKIPENHRIVLTHSFVKWSAITIPFAIRPALNDTIGSRLTADLKIGVSVSYNFNWETFKNRRIEVQKSVLGISAGLGFGFSMVTLDKSSTSLSEKPLEDTDEGLAFFITPGIGINLKGFKVVGFYGWDLGLTKNVAAWNYNKRPYIGIGLGIDISTLGK
jgi:hypothetical protein